MMEPPQCLKIWWLSIWFVLWSNYNVVDPASQSLNSVTVLKSSLASWWNLWVVSFLSGNWVRKDTCIFVVTGWIDTPIKVKLITSPCSKGYSTSAFYFFTHLPIGALLFEALENLPAQFNQFKIPAVTQQHLEKVEGCEYFLKALYILFVNSMFAGVSPCSGWNPQCTKPSEHHSVLWSDPWSTQLWNRHW